MNIAVLKSATGIDVEADRDPAETVKSAAFDSRPVKRDSLSENFNREIEAWARHARAANGFGDGP